MEMHDDEVSIDAGLVARLLAEQVPRLSDLPLTKVRSTGTVNAVYRIGDHLAARLPRVERWAPDLSRELTWLPTLAPQLALQVPHPVFTGAATDYYPLPWAVYDWIDGASYADDLVDDEVRAAGELAQFVTELRRVDPHGAPPAGRRPLRELDEVTRAAITASAGVIDSTAATAAWDDALGARGWRGDPVWIHADLLPPNILVDRGRLRAVIDWGGAGVGDPAADVIAAWSVFLAPGRRAFREALDVDDDTWNRARGFALHQAAIIIPYYRHSNPDFVTMAARTIREIVASRRG